MYLEETDTQECFLQFRKAFKQISIVHLSQRLEAIDKEVSNIHVTLGAGIRQQEQYKVMSFLLVHHLHP